MARASASAPARGRGYPPTHIGSGAGYGGNGGASSVLPGGGTYGSAQQPVDRGSGGGRGWRRRPEALKAAARFASPSAAR